MFALRTANLIIAFIATTAPIAHTLEMISKLTLDGPLWLGIQQHLYRGWGEIFWRAGFEISVLWKTAPTHRANRTERGQGWFVALRSML
jgi:hypothetical protein